MNLSLTSFNIITPLVFLLTYFSAFKGGKMICDNYLRNTFLYILSVYCLFITSLSYEKENNLMNQKNNLRTIGFIVTFIAIFGLYFTKNIILRHLCLFAIIIFIGLSSYDFINQFDPEIIEQTAIRTFIATILSILFVLKYGHLLKEKGYNYLLSFFLVLFIVYLLDVHFISKSHSLTYSYIFIAVFVGFLLYDIKFILQRKQNCNSSNVDYIDTTLDIFLDTMNIFKQGLLLSDN